MIMRTSMIRGGAAEPTGSGTFLSFKAFLYSKRKISEDEFPWDKPLNRPIWNLFDIGPKSRPNTAPEARFLQVTDRHLIPF
jgi:hypothetical protein